jgi:hypothetical protein
MKTIRTLVILFFCFFCYHSILFAQEHAAQIAEPEHSFKHFRASAALYHTYIKTESATDKKYLIVPSLGFDLEYWFTEKFGLGSHNDLELISFEVEKEGHTTLERENPMLFTMDALWKPYKGLVLLLGPGVEFEKTENLFVVRGGLEYEFELKSSHWDISPTIFYDSRRHAYDTFSFGLGVGKRF